MLAHVNISFFFEYVCVCVNGLSHTTDVPRRN
jgi:hypothetical protein